MSKEETNTNERTGFLNQIHIAEYQALTTRTSYWIILQAGLLPVVPIYLALAVQIWRDKVLSPAIVVWGTLAGLQLVGILWASVLAETYAAVKYIECHLRLLVQKTVGTDLFWGYEPYLTLHRPTRRYLGEGSIPVLAILVFGTICFVRFSSPTYTYTDIIGSAANLILLLFLIKKSLKAISLMREWSTVDQSLAQRIDDLRFEDAEIDDEPKDA